MKETDYLRGRSDLIGKLKSIPSLRKLDDALIRELLTPSKIRMYEPGEYIIREGEFDPWLYVIISGEVQVLKNGGEITRLSQIGDIFGEMGLIDGAARSATVIAVTHTTCLATDTSFMEDMEQEEKNAFYSAFYRLFAEILANRLRDTSSELAAAQKEIKQLKARVAELEKE